MLVTSSSKTVVLSTVILIQVLVNSSLFSANAASAFAVISDQAHLESELISPCNAPNNSIQICLLSAREPCFVV